MATLRCSWSLEEGRSCFCGVLLRMQSSQPTAVWNLVSPESPPSGPALHVQVTRPINRRYCCGLRFSRALRRVGVARLSIDFVASKRLIELGAGEPTPFTVGVSIRRLANEYFRQDTSLSRFSRASSLREAPTISLWRSSADLPPRTPVVTEATVALSVPSVTHRRLRIAVNVSSLLLSLAATLSGIPHKGHVRKGEGWPLSAPHFPRRRRRR